MVTPSTAVSTSGSGGVGVGGGGFSKKPVVRKGPLWTAMALLFSIPLIVLSVLNTSLEHDLRGLDRLDELVESKHWQPERLVVAKSKNAQCVRLEDTGQLVLEESDFVQVLQVDKEGLWWFQKKKPITTTIVAEASSSSKTITLEEVQKEQQQQKLGLVSGFVDNNETPWRAAERLMEAEMPRFIRVSSSSSSYKATKAMSGMDNGGIPRDASLLWHFLGRTRTNSGSFMYSYLFREVDSSPDKSISMSMSQVKEALLQGKFADVKDVTTVAFALAYFDSSR